MKYLTKIFDGNIVSLLSILILGIAFGAVIKSGLSNDNKVKEVSLYSDTLVLENQGQIDIYQVDNGKWLVISLDDLKYIVKKKRKTIISDLESLFERFEVPDKIHVKPTFK